MNLTLYLPDEIGQRAKEAELNLSRLLRDAVTDELQRREAVAKTLETTMTYDVEIEDENGTAYTGRITGKLIAQDGKKFEVEVFLTDDDRVIVYERDKLRYTVVDGDPVTELRDWLPDDVYVEALVALGEKPVIDL